MPSHRNSVCSPAWSSESWDGAQAGSAVPPCARQVRRTGTPGRRGTHGGRLGSGQRQSASEREKLRMRTLARALHELRRFLPPSVAPTGQSLTKIETLRLAIRYIGHLSAVLGLSEDSLRRQRHADAASPRGCPLCPDGGPAQSQTLGLRLSPAACSGVSWGPGPRTLIPESSRSHGTHRSCTLRQRKHPWKGRRWSPAPRPRLVAPSSRRLGGTPAVGAATHSPTARTIS